MSACARAALHMSVNTMTICTLLFKKHQLIISPIIYIWKPIPGLYYNRKNSSDEYCNEYAEAYHEICKAYHKGLKYGFYPGFVFIHLFDRYGQV
jgi:hypothetical protein